jgi:Ca2+-binding EF-hand superfamily protein
MSTDDKSEIAFKAFDKNHDGYITKGEMLKVSKNLTKEQVTFREHFVFMIKRFSDSKMISSKIFKDYWKIKINIFYDLFPLLQ